MAKLAFLLGLFVVPLALLLAGHGFRRRSPRGRALFWGAALGYLAGVLLTTTLAMLPAVQWSDSLTPRTLVVHWSMLLGALLGAALGWVAALRGARAG